MRLMTCLHRISVVDDDESFGRALVSVLRATGFEARGFASAEEFLRSASLDATDCLILDLQMPGMNGIELQRHLLERGSRIPIVFVSGYPGEAKSSALANGAAAFLEKPLRHEALLEAIAAATSISRK